MFTFVLTWIGNLLSGPIAKAMLQAYQSKLTATNTSEKIAADLAIRELDVQQKEIEVDGQLRIAEIGRWYEPDHLAAYVFVAYIGKVVIWDTMLDLGSTPAIHGDVGTWLGMIAAFLFAKRGIENVARIIKR